MCKLIYVDSGVISSKYLIGVQRRQIERGGTITVVLHTVSGKEFTRTFGITDMAGAENFYADCTILLEDQN